jgi:hypothetical protein
MDCSDGQLGHQFFHVNTEVSTILVGGFNPSEKYESDWIIIPTGKNKIHVRNHQPEIIKIYQP